VSVAVEAVWPAGSIYDGWRSGGNKRSEISRVSGRKPKAFYSCVLEFSTRASNIANHIFIPALPKALKAKSQTCSAVLNTEFCSTLQPTLHRGVR
jgi:hypothetical protein